MSFDSKDVKKYAEFKFKLAKKLKKDQPLFTQFWNETKHLPIFIQFLSLWHGSEINKLKFYLKRKPFEIVGVVEFSQELRHKITSSKPEYLLIKDYLLKFLPTDFPPFQKNPFQNWEADHAKNFNPLGINQVNYKSEGQRGRDQGQQRQGIMPDPGTIINSVVSLITVLKDVGLEINKVINERRQRNQPRCAAIRRIGADLSAIFSHTCHVFIRKDTDIHKGNRDFYGVLFEETFIIANTPYRVYVFREGTFTRRERCSKDHHWFAFEKDNDFTYLWSWRKCVFPFWPLKKNSYHFQRKGEILSDEDLEHAKRKAQEYFKAPPAQQDQAVQAGPEVQAVQGNQAQAQAVQGNQPQPVQGNQAQAQAQAVQGNQAQVVQGNQAQAVQGNQPQPVQGVQAV